MKLAGEVVDLWVKRYDRMKSKLLELNVPEGKTDDYYWLTHNLKDYVKDANQIKKILNELFEIHQRY